jgi:hypothetical protein
MPFTVSCQAANEARGDRILAAVQRRVAGPGDRARQLGAEPQHRVAAVGRQGQQQRAAGRAGALGERGKALAEIVDGQHLALGRFQQRVQRMLGQLGAGRGPQQRGRAAQTHQGAAGIHQAQQIGLPLHQRVGQGRRNGHGIGQRTQRGVAHQALGQGFGLTQALQQQRHHLSDGVGSGPQLGPRHTRSGMVADQHAPEHAAVHQRHRQAGGGVHVAHVLAMDGRRAAQGAVREVQRRAIVQRRVGEQRHRRGGGVADAAHALAQEQPARLRRDVGRRVAQAQKRLQPCVARLGDDLAVPVFAKAIGHHAVVAGDGLQPLHRQFAQMARADGLVEGAQHGLRHDDGQALWGLEVHGLDVHADMAARAVCMQVQRAAKRRVHQVHLGLRDAARGPHVQQRTAGRRTQHLLQRTTQRQPGRRAQQRCKVGADVADQQAVGQDGQEGTVRLDGAWRVDGFALAQTRIQRGRAVACGQAGGRRTGNA